MFENALSRSSARRRKIGDGTPPPEPRRCALLNARKNEECAHAAEAKAAENSDLYVYYSWGGTAYIRMKDYNRARRILLQGLSKGKRKSPICDTIAECEWKARNAKEATYWWAQALHCQQSIKHESIRDYDASTYLYLSYVAHGLGLADVAAAFLTRVDRIESGQVRLDAQTASDLLDLVRGQATPGMRDVLRGLRDRYLKSGAPPEAEEKLGQLLRQIESQLKERPNRAFPMVTLRLQTTPLGTEIVWCYPPHDLMDVFAAAEFLNQELKAIRVTVSYAGYMEGSSGSYALFSYKFQNAV